MMNGRDIDTSEIVEVSVTINNREIASVTGNTTVFALVAWDLGRTK